jgi:hypothetical protein
MRADLSSATNHTWNALGRAGEWMDGARRAKIVAETRAARVCRLCQRRAASLSPYAPDPASHDSASDLPPAVVEAVHRIATDSGRLTRRWFDGLRAAGVAETTYVELVSVVALAAGIDTMRRAAGMQPLAPPFVVAGEPGRREPAGATPSPAWVRHLAPRDVGPGDPPLYANRAGAYIHRALSLVPRAMMQFWDWFEVAYLPQDAMRDFAREFRAVDHAQIEMLAARVAALNRCTY